MSQNLSQDYLKFSREILKSSKSAFEIDNALTPKFKKHHRSVYAIALLVTKLEKESTEEHKLVYLAEILSDILTLTKLAFLGFEAPALILLRRTIENFYNHIYYTHHPIEFEQLNLGKNEYTPIDKLKLYVDAHPNFVVSRDNHLKEFNQNLFNVYQRLCKVVHSKGIDSLNLSKCLHDLTQEFEIGDFLNQLIEVEVCLVYITYKFHKSLQFTATEKSVITAVIPTNKRTQLHE